MATAKDGESDCRTLPYGREPSVKSLIAGCPGLVPGWRAFPAINRVLLPTPPPVLSRPGRVPAGARKDRWRRTGWQLRIVAVYRAPPRHKTGGSLKNAKQVSGWRPGSLSRFKFHPWLNRQGARLTFTLEVSHLVRRSDGGRPTPPFGHPSA